MIRNCRCLKYVAVFFALEILASSVLPSLSWALTTGPASPDAASFEPVDTTDMVNLVTGDFVYNLPLLEVPGPGGGYPLSLSYHAGIKLDQDASWVGLGWTLNPGAINRTVSGFADDHQDVPGTDRTFWEGGESRQYSVGLTVGYGGQAPISAGIVVADDTYKGVGVGYYYSADFEEKAPVGLRSLFSANMGFQAGVSPYGDRYSSTGLSVGISRAAKLGGAASMNLGVSFDQDGKASGSLYTGYNGIGASMSTNGGVAFSGKAVGGRVHNGRAGQLSTSGYDYSATIPLGNFGLRLSASYQRYWIDESAIVATNGALYFPSMMPSSAELDTRAFDVYDLQNPDDSHLYGPQSDAPYVTPDESVAGAFIDYDTYSVLGQGISGSIRPYHYQAYLLRQNRKDGDKYRVKSYPLGVNNTAHFRFVGDFSNRYEHDADFDDFISNTSNPFDFEFDGNRITGENGNDGYDASRNLLPGSKSVEWFTNKQINDNEPRDHLGNPLPPTSDAALHKGFIDCRALGFVRENNSQIGGFKVINESGVTYHYALPAYSFDEHQYTGRQDEENRHWFNVLKKPERYAYTWLLTAVTGPDFVDTNLNGYADDADWGHWVNFEYGLWSDFYSWRNPASGFNKDVDHSFNTFSKGKKQVYYLNAIRTKSHTAFFIKEMRPDGKGVVHQLADAVHTNVNHDVSGIDGGSYQPTWKGQNGSPFLEYPVSALRLHSIYLVQNHDFADYASLSDLAAAGDVFFHSQNLSSDAGKYTYGDFVLDIHDLSQEPVESDLKAKCLRKIVFNVDYSLSPGTPNSYWSALDVANTTGTVTDVLGKLTLTGVKVYGRGEADLIPETRFRYDDARSFFASVETIGNSGENSRLLKVSGRASEFDFKKGDIVRFSSGSSHAYGYVRELREGSKVVEAVFYQGIELVPSSGIQKFCLTKNPAYAYDFHDLWGNFKVDMIQVDPEGRSHTENVRRMTTSISAGAVDVWSLREISTSLGASIKVEYESDSYRSALKSLANIPVMDIETVAGGATRVYLYEDVSEYGLAAGDWVNVRFLTAKRYDVNNPAEQTELRFDCNGVKSTHVYQWYLHNDWGDEDIAKIQIISASGNAFTIDYDFAIRYPLGEATCFQRSSPYKEQDHDPGHMDSCIKLDWLTASEPIFLGGEVIVDNVFSPHGGDLRVSKLSLQRWSETRATKYEYINGVTPYEPVGLSIPVAKLHGTLSGCLMEVQNSAFESFREKSFDTVYDRFEFLFSNSRDLPGPGVLYEWVRVTESINRVEGMTDVGGRVEYQFEVFSPETIHLSMPGDVFLTNPLYSRIEGAANYGRTEHLRDINGGLLGLDVVAVHTTNSSTKPVIKDFTSIMGALKKMVYYDRDGRKISETINHYLHDNFSENSYLDGLQSFKNQGLITETFSDARIILNPDASAVAGSDAYILHGLVSQKVRFPNVQTGYTTINHKTGIKTQVGNLAFDYYSGSPVKVVEEDSYGVQTITETIPAYHHYPSMGLKGLDGGKNMLVQAAGSVVYRVSEDGVSGILSADATTWTNEMPFVIDADRRNDNPAAYNVWRPRTTFHWKGDEAGLVRGLYPETEFIPFNYNAPLSNPGAWQKSSEATLADIYSHVLEGEDISGVRSATLMSSDNLFIIAHASNAGYSDVAYSGAEDRLIGDKLGGNVSVSQAQINTDPLLVHTGMRSLTVDPNASGFTYEVSKSDLHCNCDEYFASVWVKGSTAGALPSVSLRAETDGGVLLGAAGPREDRTANGWYLVELRFDLPSDGLIRVLVRNTSASDILYLDDFRVHPANSGFMSYVYNGYGDLSHILDGNNLFTEFRYDGVGRLKETYRESFQYGIVKTDEVIYHHYEYE